MSDDLTKRGKQERARINLQERWEVQHWAKVLGSYKEELEQAIQVVGNFADEVREHLRART